ncbi:hypothetical protein P4O66_011554 [Electrophorus voltai]|uniref:Uncharacterized protein n=1 Tax=Electrophorus voltai TaxID=2609070 RepID=A0AAD9DVH7_9TELE|nr:hypothetical protein P4O66_011554 [Electrophorus voltai]
MAPDEDGWELWPYLIHSPRGLLAWEMAGYDNISIRSDGERVRVGLLTAMPVDTKPTGGLDFTGADEGVRKMNWCNEASRFPRPYPSFCLIPHHTLIIAICDLIGPPATLNLAAPREAESRQKLKVARRREPERLHGIIKKNELASGDARLLPGSLLTSDTSLHRRRCKQEVTQDNGGLKTRRHRTPPNPSGTGHKAPLTRPRRRRLLYHSTAHADSSVVSLTCSAHARQQKGRREDKRLLANEAPGVAARLGRCTTSRARARDRALLGDVSLRARCHPAVNWVEFGDSVSEQSESASAISYHPTKARGR